MVKMDQYPAWFQDVSGWMLHRNQGPNIWSIGNSHWKKGLVSGDWSEICVTLRQVWDLVETKWVDFKLDNCRGIRLSCSEGRVTNRMSRGDFCVAIWGGVCHWCPFHRLLNQTGVILPRNKWMIKWWYIDIYIIYIYTILFSFGPRCFLSKDILGAAHAIWQLWKFLDPPWTKSRVAQWFFDFTVKQTVRLQVLQRFKFMSLSNSNNELNFITRCAQSGDACKWCSHHILFRNAAIEHPPSDDSHEKFHGSFRDFAGHVWGRWM